jgi:hypothetical protein
LVVILWTLGIVSFLAAGSAAFSEEFLMGLVFLIAGVALIVVARAIDKRK